MLNDIWGAAFWSESFIQCNQMRLLACEREAQDTFISAPSNT